MATVNTANGAIDTAALGATLMHEHVFMFTTETLINYPEVWGWSEKERISDAISRLNELKGAGVDSIVDLTVCGLGRYIPWIKAIAGETDINIVTATGFYTLNELPTNFHYRGPGKMFDEPEPLITMFLKDIQEGVGDTGVKAAVLKSATDELGVTSDIERVLRAVASAHRTTGVPISTHTHAVSRQGLEQQRIFKEEGVDLSRVVIGHSGDTTDTDYLEELIAAGSYIGMDRFGIDVMLPFEDRVATVARMCELNHADKMVLSHDACCWADGTPEEGVRRVLPNWNYMHISRDVIPALKEKGVTDDQLHQMLVVNPKAIFERQGGY